MLQTTSNGYNVTHFASPPCDDVAKQISVIAVNEYGPSPASSVIHLGRFYLHNVTSSRLQYAVIKKKKKMLRRLICYLHWIECVCQAAIFSRCVSQIMSYCHLK